ncbi:MAG: nickel pincer cofactor biosynthesis protein LarB [Planctomycetota bacterium]|nr:MAG: nickel pincer cofactor biosynthesis protein LarB [Planctomycetota bacterium]
MDREHLRKLLQAFQQGELEFDQLEAKLLQWPLQNQGDVQLDTQRQMRCGFPETVFAAGKSPQQVVRAVAGLRQNHDRLLVTRADQEHAEAVQAQFPEVEWHPEAGCLLWRQQPAPKDGPAIAVLAAGTSDFSVAEEVRLCLEIQDLQVRFHIDVGVAGIHRLIRILPDVRSCSVFVVVAGMEGALPSVVAGLVEAPVIAVPTSVGYGASFGGVTALLAMLNSCAPGIGVVNIDNGFGAAMLAAKIARQGPNRPSPS